MKLIILDRDGVILEEVGYLHSVRDMRLVPGVAEVIAAANARGVKASYAPANINTPADLAALEQDHGI